MSEPLLRFPIVLVLVLVLGIHLDSRTTTRTTTRTNRGLMGWSVLHGLVAMDYLEPL
jgi:hypothetical protein